MKILLLIIASLLIGGYLYVPPAECAGVCDKKHCTSSIECGYYCSCVTFGDWIGDCVRIQ